MSRGTIKRVGRILRKLATGIGVLLGLAALGAALLEYLPFPEPVRSTRIGAPTELTAVAGAGQVTLRWSMGPDAIWFQVERADGDGGRFAPLSGASGLLTGLKRRVLTFILPGLPLDSLAGQMYVDTLVDTGKVYRYRVVAWDGERPSEPSPEVRVSCPVDQIAGNVVVRVDAGRDLGTLDHVWEGLVNQTDLVLLRDQAPRKSSGAILALRLLHDELGAQRMRVHGIFGEDLGIYRDTGAGAPTFDWRRLDAVFDGMRADGYTPWVLLSYMPRDLASLPEKPKVWGSNTSPPKDIAKWSVLVSAFAAHLVERYGRDEVATWFFEVWSEPDLHLRKADFWTGTLEEYFRLFDASAAALRSVDTRLRVGGPGAASLPTVEAFLRHTSTARIPLDFVSVHLYGAGLIDFRPLLGRYGFDDVPVFYSEWGVSGREEEVHDLPFAAAWIARVVLENAGSATLGYWAATDDLSGASNEALFHGGFGLLAADGLRKPSYQGLALLHRLGSRRVAVEGSGDGFAGLVQALGARSEDGAVQVLLTNATYDQSKALGSAALSRHIDLQISGLRPSASYRLSHSRIDNANAGAFGAWERLGKPSHPSDEELAQLRAADRIDLLEPSRDVTADASGLFRTSFDLPMPGLSLVELVPPSAANAAQPPVGAE